MALFRGIQEYIALDANNITLVFDSGNIVNISGNIFLYPPKKSHPILYKYHNDICYILAYVFNSSDFLLQVALQHPDHHSEFVDQHSDCGWLEGTGTI